MFSLFLALPLLVVSPVSSPTPDPGPTVRIATGTLRGTLYGKAAVFKGVPYAAPPVGTFRWREPQPVAKWTGVRDATHPGDACLQNPEGLNPFIAPLAEAYGARYLRQPVPSSEDCLYLNVWTPEWPAAKSHPVMVWLHGGSNRAGSGSQPTYDGASLTAHGVVLVTINYRLGVMGFFSHPELTRESAHHSSGNYGLLDQLAALRWVQQNIAQFGGDPGNVTLFGESAGSIDAGMLIASPLSSGLFRRAILESGPPFGLGAPHTLAQAEPVGSAIGNAAPAASGAATGLEKLRAMPAAEVVQLAASVVKSQFQGFDPNSPIVDGWVLREPPARAFAAGRQQRVDLMIGLNGRELSAFRVDAAALAKEAGPQPASGGAGAAIKTFEDAARPIYGNWTTPALSIYLGKAILDRVGAIDQAGNDMLMACPVGAVAALTAAAGQRAYVYRFDRAIPGKGASTLGAFHGLEIPYVFNAFDDNGWNWLPFTQADRELGRTIEEYWTNFAKTGDPSGDTSGNPPSVPNLPKWSVWQSGGEPYMNFTKEAQASLSHSFSPTFCHLAPDRLKDKLGSN